MKLLVLGFLVLPSLVFAKLEIFGGRNNSVTAQTATLELAGWSQDAAYAYADTAESLYVTTSQAGGVDSLDITYLDQNWNRATIREVFTAGNTSVSVGVLAQRIERIENIGPAAFGGTVYVSAVSGIGSAESGVPTDIRALVISGEGRSDMSRVTVPLGDEWRLYGVSGSVFSDASTPLEGRFVLRSRLRFEPHTLTFQTVVPFPFQIDSIQYDFYYTFPEPLELPAQSDWELDVEAATGTVGGFFVSGGALYVEN